MESQLFRQPQRTLLEANQAVHELLLKAQVDVNEATGEVDPVVKLIDFHHPERNRFHAINQFRIATPGCVREFIVPDIVLFVNGIPLAVVECKKGSATCANPMQEAFCAAAALHAPQGGDGGCRPEGGRAPPLPQQPAAGAHLRAGGGTTAASAPARSTSMPGRRCTRPTMPPGLA